MLEMHIILKGNVQGVGLRATVKMEADKRKLTGFIRNLNNDSVEIVIQGEKKDMDSLLTLLKAKFHILNIEQDFYDTEDSYEIFTIQP
jgi:acylphosphatase